MIAFPSAAVIGQAELIGEPWRHYVTVTAIVCTAVWAYCMRPGTIKDVLLLMKRR